MECCPNLGLTKMLILLLMDVQHGEFHCHYHREREGGRGQPKKLLLMPLQCSLFSASPSPPPPLSSLSSSSSSKLCIDSLPAFKYQGADSPVLPVGVQVIIPSYQFTCDGTIERWGWIIDDGKGPHDGKMQVWRRSSEDPDIYVKVGENHISIRPKEGQNKQHTQPGDNHKLSVQAGDVLGLYLEDNTTAVDDFSVQYRAGVVGSEVLYQSATGPLQRMNVSEHAKEVVRLANAAPIITVGECLLKLYSGCVPDVHRNLSLLR